MSPLPPVQLLELPEPRTAARGLLPLGHWESGFFRNRAMLPMGRRMVDKQFGCWVFCRVVNFVFKSGSSGQILVFSMCTGVKIQV